MPFLAWTDPPAGQRPARRRAPRESPRRAVASHRRGRRAEASARRKSFTMRHGTAVDAQTGGLTVGKGFGVWRKLTAGTPPGWVALLLWVVVAVWAALETVRR